MPEGDGKVEHIERLRVPPGYHEAARLDVYITRFLPNASRNKVQQGIKAGHVTVSGTIVVKPSHPVQAGDEIMMRLMRPPPLAVEPEPIPLDIVYEDEVLLVVNKAAGMVVHPAYGNRTGTLVHALLYHVGGGTFSVEDDHESEEEEDVGLSTIHAAPVAAGDLSIRPGIVHRLDKDTSGLLVVAKTDAAHTHLAKQFLNRTIQRRYLALVWGVPSPESGTIDTWLARDPRDRKRMAVVSEGKGKQAITHFEAVEEFRHTALLRFRLETGRTHQIRVHAQHINHPVLGDATYGGNRLVYGPTGGSRHAFFKNLFHTMPRQALHAHTLGFRHPASGELLHFVAELPDDMQYVLDRLRTVEGA